MSRLPTAAESTIHYADVPWILAAEEPKLEELQRVVLFGGLEEAWWAAIVVNWCRGSAADDTFSLNAQPFALLIIYGQAPAGRRSSGGGCARSLCAGTQARWVGPRGGVGASRGLSLLRDWSMHKPASWHNVDLCTPHPPRQVCRKVWQAAGGWRPGPHPGTRGPHRAAAECHQCSAAQVTVQLSPTDLTLAPSRLTSSACISFLQPRHAAHDTWQTPRAEKSAL